MRIRVHEMHYPDDVEGPDEEEVVSWIYKDVAGVLRQNADNLLKAAKQVYPNASSDAVKVKIEDSFYTEGRDYIRLEARVKCDVVLTLPDAALADEPEQIDSLLESATITYDREGWLSDLTWECVNADVTDDETILECELSGTYDKERFAED